MATASDLANLTAIPNRQACTCQIWEFKVGHSSLHILVSEPDSGESWWMFLRDVVYFEGPMMWRGADFKISAPDESAQFARQRLPHGMITTGQNGREVHHLFTVNSSEVTVHILAGSAMVSRAAANWVT